MCQNASYQPFVTNPPSMNKILVDTRALRFNKVRDTTNGYDMGPIITDTGRLNILLTTSCGQPPTRAVVMRGC